MCSMFCILIYLHYCSIFLSDVLSTAYLCDRCRTCTCRMCSEPVHHPFGNDASYMNLWDEWFSNCSTYFWQPENDDCCIRDFGSVILLFSDTLISGVWLKNSEITLPKWWMEDTQGRHQITCDNRANRVLICHLSSLMSCIGFHSIEYGRVSLRLQPSHLLAIIGIMFMYTN
jgi:hypothetical protein